MRGLTSHARNKHNIRKKELINEDKDVELKKIIKDRFEVGSFGYEQ